MLIPQQLCTILRITHKFHFIFFNFDFFRSNLSGIRNNLLFDIIHRFLSTLRTNFVLPLFLLLFDRSALRPSLLSHLYSRHLLELLVAVGIGLEERFLDAICCLCYFGSLQTEAQPLLKVLREASYHLGKVIQSRNLFGLYAANSYSGAAPSSFQGHEHYRLGLATAPCSSLPSASSQD